MIQNTNPNAVSVKLSEDHSLWIKAKSIGSSIIKIQLMDNPSVFDIFIVNVGTIIQPSSPVAVHEGGTISFSAGSRHQGSEFFWSSENGNIVEIDPISGKAKAIKEGKTNIFFNHIIQYTAKVVVFKANKILMNEYKSPSKMTSVPSHPKFQNEYIFYFRVISDDKEIKAFNENRNEGEINNNLRFECETEFPEALLSKGDIIFDQKENQQVPICTVVQKKGFYINDVFQYFD